MAVTDQGALAQGLRVSTGVHWASGTRSRKVPFDVGTGVVYERAAAAADTKPVVDKSAVSQAAPRERRFGGYIEAASRLSASGTARSWLGGRAELLRNSAGGDPIMNLTARLSWEVYGGGVSAGAEGASNGFIAYVAGGTVGVGSYVEAGLQSALGGDKEFLVTAGLSLRLPAILAVGLACR